ncbi:hypothetical protein SLS64_008061 [Diaporthe eres]
MLYSAWVEIAKFKAQDVDIDDQILGSVVKNYLDPVCGDHLPDSPLRYNDEAFDEKSFNDFDLANSVSSDSEAGVSVTSIMGVSLKGKTVDKTHLQGKLVHIKRLQKTQQFFNKLKEDSEFQRRVPGWMRMLSLRKPVCLVVGIMVCEDVELSYEGSKVKDREGQLEIPVKEVLLGGTDAALGKVGNPEFVAVRRHEAATEFKGKQETRTICALELKRVTTRVLSRKKAPVLDERDLNPGGGRWLGDEDLSEQIGDVEIDDILLEDMEI